VIGSEGDEKGVQLSDLIQVRSICRKLQEAPTITQPPHNS